MTIDSREDPALEARLEALGALVETARLPTGDFALDRSVVVERKRIYDLHDSLATGRLWWQMGRLRREARWAYLLIEGADIDAGPMPAAAIRGAVLALMEQGVRVVRTTDVDDSALWIYRLAHRVQREYRPRILPDYRFHATARASPAEAMLAATPGISVKTARALLDHFGSVAVIANAGPDELRAVKGVGKRRAATLSSLFNSSARSADEEAPDPST